MTKMLIDRAVVEQALEALEFIDQALPWPAGKQAKDAITTLRAALAEPVEEPVTRSQAWHDGVIEGHSREREYWLAQQAEPVQEPVAYRYSVQPQVIGPSVWAFSETNDTGDAQPLYTS